MYLLFIRNKMRSHRACFTMRQRTSTKQTEIIYSAYGSALMSSAPQITRDSTSITNTAQIHASFAETWNGHKKRTSCKTLIHRRFRTSPKYKASLLYLFRTIVATPCFYILLNTNQLQTLRVASLRKILVSEHWEGTVAI
jgi:hypothetical protein